MVGTITSFPVLYRGSGQSGSFRHYMMIDRRVLLEILRIHTTEKREKAFFPSFDIFSVMLHAIETQDTPENGHCWELSSQISQLACQVIVLSVDTHRLRLPAGGKTAASLPERRSAEVMPHYAIHLSQTSQFLHNVTSIFNLTTAATHFTLCAHPETFRETSHSRGERLAAAGASQVTRQVQLRTRHLDN